MDVQNRNKALIAPLRAALYDFSAKSVRAALGDLMLADTPVRLCHPFGTVEGPGAFFEAAYAPLADAMPDLERADFIVMAGADEDGSQWVGCGGHYVGTFEAPFLGIPPSGQPAAMRYHEFFRFEDERIVEVQAIWDLPELMMQAGAWPMAPSLGREWRVPAPASGDGIVAGPYDPASSHRARDIVVAMLEAMKRHPREPAQAMNMPRFWHPRMSWYGPAGIGTCRQIKGFRHVHQIPFLNGMPDRGQYVDEITYHFFADGPYVAVTGWPNMIQTINADGWLGIAPVDKRITMRSLDFWRIENGRIRENWVLVDLLDMYRQIGVDVFARLAEMTKTRAMTRVSLPEDPAG
ncbi:MAG: ester cyclase [Pseudomonadota bacterium]